MTHVYDAIAKALHTLAKCACASILTYVSVCARAHVCVFPHHMHDHKTH